MKNGIPDININPVLKWWFVLIFRLASVATIVILGWRINFLMKETKQQRDIIFNLKEEVKVYSNSLMMMSLIDQESPFPSGTKSIDGIVIHVNKPYLIEYIQAQGKKLSDYLGKRDRDFWGEQAAVQFESLRYRARIKRRAVTDSVDFINVFNGHRVLGEATVWPKFDNRGNIIAYGFQVNKDFR